MRCRRLRQLHLQSLRQEREHRRLAGGKPDAISPDLICNLDPKTGDAIADQGLGRYPMDMGVVMVGIPNSPLGWTPQGEEVIGPRHSGFDFGYYLPIEQLYRAGRP